MKELSSNSPFTIFYYIYSKNTKKCTTVICIKVKNRAKMRLSYIYECDKSIYMGGEKH